MGTGKHRPQQRQAGMMLIEDSGTQSPASTACNACQSDMPRLWRVHQNNVRLQSRNQFSHHCRGIRTPHLRNVSCIKVDSAEGATLRVPVSQSLRSEEHTSELQSLMRISYAVFCLKKKKKT